MSVWPQYTELHVVSDLHLGGETPQRQIFDQRYVFSRMIDELLRAPCGDGQALLINGDLVDFLAEPNPVYFDAVNASAKLDRILKDPSFTPVWDALRKFVKTPGRTLIITLGNHDLELALPWVRTQLLRALADGDAEARNRIVLAFEEGGYRARVGGADVLCVHGNEVDPWNATDYERLRRIGQNEIRGTASEAWIPNGGTRLVIDVMNGIKRKYPFVDLLKPEGSAVIPILVALEPDLLRKIADALPSWARSRWDQVRLRNGMLAGEETLPATQEKEESGTEGKEELRTVKFLGGVLEESFGKGAKMRFGADLEELLNLTDTRHRDGVEPLDLLKGSGPAEFLGMIGAVKSLLRREGKAEVMRQALERLLRDKSFHPNVADDTYSMLDRRVDPDIQFLVAGHTHLERALPRGNNGYYYNSGTWARLIQLDEKTLSGKDEFKETYKAFEQGRMDSLDAQPGLVRRRPTVVSFRADAGGTHGVLQCMRDHGLTADEGTKHSVKIS